MKQAYKYYPKKEILAGVQRDGSCVYFETEFAIPGVGQRKVMAMAHMDKVPLTLVATCGTS